MRQKKKGFVLYNDQMTPVDSLTDEEAGKLFKAIFHYECNGEIPILEQGPQMAFIFISQQLDRDREKYEERCRKNRESGKKGGEAKAKASATKS